MKPSTQTSGNGFTLVEVLVALVIGMIVVGSALALTLSSRQIYELDEARTSVNQNLRNALTVIGADVREAGERLPTSAGNVFPAVEIVAGSEGTELVVRRNRLGVQPTLCTAVSGSSATLVIGKANSPPYPECNTGNSTVRTSLKAQLSSWRTYREAQPNNKARAYLYNPTSKLGEFFTYESENLNGFSLSRASGNWSNTYDTPSGTPAEGQPRLYLLEERRYRKRGEYLEVVIDGDVDNPQKLVYGVEAFNIKARLRTGPTVTALGIDDDWTQVAAFEISVTGAAKVSGRNLKRTLTGEFFPRNALNR